MPTVPSTIYGVRRGTVERFDDHVGAGTVVDAGDGRRWWFHCTRLVDPSRSIGVGANVQFRVATGSTGLEAVEVAETGPPSST